MTDVAYIALGSNLGDRHAILARARSALARLPHSRILAVSGIEETVPVGPVEQGMFLNQMIAMETSLHPEALLDQLLLIEKAEGRTRNERWGPRTLDLDIVRFDRTTFHSSRLTIPHPELPNRDFWKEQLIELRGTDE
jgi:2-amino-4-hydroxy-6-hydroxymethyldihydropteridine diphosphokinase